MFSYITYCLSTFTGKDCPVDLTRNVMRKLSLVPFPRGLYSVKRPSRLPVFGSCELADIFHTLCRSPVSVTGNASAGVFSLLLFGTLAKIGQKPLCFLNCGAVGKPFDFLRISDCLISISTCKLVIRICH